MFPFERINSNDSLTMEAVAVMAGSEISVDTEHGSPTDQDNTYVQEKAKAKLQEHLEIHHADYELAQKVKNLMFGGIDGVITTFAIVSAGIGGNLADETILMMGLANCVADAFSMGFGDFVSSNAERNYVESEREKEASEFRKDPEEEKEEMIMLLQMKGFTKDDATQMTNVLSKYEDSFIEEMLKLELSLEPQGSVEELMWEAVITFTSFIISGAIPLVTYYLVAQIGLSQSAKMLVCCGVCALVLFMIGAVTANITKQPLLGSGLNTMLNGMVAGAIAFGLGVIFGHG